MIVGLTFGKSKPIDKVTRADVLPYPDWMWALDEDASRTVSTIASSSP